MHGSLIHSCMTDRDIPQPSEPDHRAEELWAGLDVSFEEWTTEDT